MKIGTHGDKHDIVHPDYATWGIEGTISINPRQLTDNAIEKLIKQAKKIDINLKKYTLKSCNEAQHYQGEKLRSANVLLARYERSDAVNQGYEGEHISFTYDIDNDLILGLTRMQPEASDIGTLTHQQALNSAIEFLKLNAPDLMNTNIIIPKLIPLSNTDRIDFIPGFPIGKIELQWIGEHQESMMLNQEIKIVSGMKIKMFIPKYNLWAWVILDKEGKIQTFERNICWDFAKMQRKTQMWLHDKWLKTHNILL